MIYDSEANWCVTWSWGWTSWTLMDCCETAAFGWSKMQKVPLLFSGNDRIQTFLRWLLFLRRKTLSKLSSLVSAPPPSAPAALLIQSAGLAALEPGVQQPLEEGARQTLPAGPLVPRIYWSSASIIANQISMEGGGPGLGAAPQYEEQLLHTQVENSGLLFQIV